VRRLSERTACAPLGCADGEARQPPLKLQFVGGASAVTGSQFLLSTDRARILVDCGMFQGSPSDVARNRLPLPYRPAEVDALLLTHAHLDHCGLIPLLVRQGFRGTIYATNATVELARLVLLDSAKIQLEQWKDRRRRPRRRALRGDTQQHAERYADEPRGARDAGHETPDAGHETPDNRRGTRGNRHETPGERSKPTDEDGEGGFDAEETLRRQPPEVETEIPAPLYDVGDARAAIGLFRGVHYDEQVEVAPGVRGVFRDAGHILGSAIVVVDASDSGSDRCRIVFSGDLGRPNTPIIRDPTAIRNGADYVLVESTYGGREHEPAQEAVRLLADAVRAVAGHSGVLLIPSFAIGRTQEVVWTLDRLVAEGVIPRVPLYLDSPMASRASDIYRAFPGYYDEETYRLLQAGETPLDYPGARVTRRARDSRAISAAPRPLMIVASNGMLTGGRVLHHLRDLIEDPGAMLLFVGYQGEGTLGAHLQGGVKRVRIDGAWRDVRCAVRSISGFSAHADESELLGWLGHFARAERRPRTVFLVHGDPGAKVALEGKVRALGLATHTPQWREEVELH
jgi:metallo-beta-lactamase family protein